MADTLPEATPQNISNFFWSLAQLEHTPPLAVLRACVDTCKGLTAHPAFNPQACSNVVSAMSHIPHAWEQLQGVQQRWCSLVHRLDRVSFCLHIVGLPRVTTADVELLQMIAARAMATLQSFKPQNIANLLWGFAKLGYNAGAEFLDLAGTHT